MRRFNVTYLTILVIGLGLWALGGATLHQRFIERSNAAHLDDLTAQVIERTEKALDYVVIAQTDLLLAGHVDCSAQAVSALTNAARRNGKASDFYLITGARTCSSFGPLSAPAPNAEERASWAQGVNPRFRLGPLAGSQSPTLGVLWSQEEDMQVLMAIPISALLFDVLPRPLRDAAQTRFLLSGYGVVAAFPEQSGVSDGPREPRLFSAASHRYPFSIEIEIDGSTFAAWRGAPSFEETAAWLALGLIILILCAETLHRTRDFEAEAVFRALCTGQIIPHFQAIVDLKTEDVIGCEALARWTKPNGTRVSPGEFIPIIERTGLSDALLTTLIRETGMQLGHLLSARPDIAVNFNVTPAQFTEPDFARRLRETVEASGLNCRQIIIEVTERQALTSPERAADVTQQLAEFGVRVAIDDVGTGHNGLAAIQQLKADCLKIDKFFIDQLALDPRARTMIQMLAAIGQRYGMKTVAEGVESETQAVQLREIGVDCVQGYLFYRPLPADDFKPILTPSFAAEAQPEGQSAA